ncbi:MAG: DUF1634 domain-containing protein [Acidobacteriota bacterium]|nr:DUF1634 domain-containing protein [Acidobacteriota bacterium]
MTTPRFSDQRMEIMMGRLLQAGVLLASTVVLAGGVLYLISNAGHLASYRVFNSEAADLRHPGQLAALIAQGNGAALIQAGILLLIATPVARVVFAVVGFALERDRLYVTISLAVLAVLLFGIFHG